MTLIIIMGQEETVGQLTRTQGRIGSDPSNELTCDDMDTYFVVEDKGRSRCEQWPSTKEES